MLITKVGLHTTHPPPPPQELNKSTKTTFVMHLLFGQIQKQLTRELITKEILVLVIIIIKAQARCVQSHDNNYNIKLGTTKFAWHLVDHEMVGVSLDSP